jgi:hypothetical protein
LVEDRLRLRSRPGGAQPIQVLVRDEMVELGPGEEREVSLEQRPSEPSVDELAGPSQGS